MKHFYKTVLYKFIELEMEKPDLRHEVLGGSEADSRRPEVVGFRLHQVSSGRAAEFFDEPELAAADTRFKSMNHLVLDTTRKKD